MEGLGFIHEKLDIKILILYILNHLPAAVDAQTLSDAEQMRRAAMIVAQHTNTPEGGCNVHLSLSDGIGRIVSMQLLAADEAQARTMEHYFKAHAEDVYQTLVRMLTESEENKA